MISYFNGIVDRLAGRLSVNLDEDTTTIQHALIAGGAAMAILLTLTLLGPSFH